MAGIGLTLERLTSRGSFTGTVHALAYCCLVSCGPWLFTIACLGALAWFADRFFDEGSVALFGNIVIYNFSFSLVLVAPLALICTRYVADCLYSRSLTTLNGVCIGTMAGGYVLAIAVSFPFYFFVAGIAADMALAATVNFILVALLWLAPIFVNAIKDYTAVLMTFASGMTVAFTAGMLLLPQYGALGLLWGLNAGVFTIVFISLGLAIAQYPDDIGHCFRFMIYFRKYWDLALTGIIYSTAMWVDKWVMWCAADNVVLAPFIVFNPTYDFPMFLAYLSIIPALSLMTLRGETTFIRHYDSFFRNIEAHAPLSYIKDCQNRMVSCLTRTLTYIVIVQGSLTLILLPLSPLIIELSGGEFRQIAILRLGLLAVFLQFIFVFVTVKLHYYDLRKVNLILQSIFLVCNGLFTYWARSFGFAFYGYGYLAACLVASVLALIVLSKCLNNITYITFVSNNPSVA